jgi:hypothetical protein
VIKLSFVTSRLALGFKGDVSVGDGFENALAADLQTHQTPDPGIKHCMPVTVCISPDAMSAPLPNLLGLEITA